MLFTYSQVKESSVVEVAGVGPETTQFLKLVNQGIELLMNRGDWPGITEPMQVCVRAGCITWPRIVHRVRRLNLCNHHTDVESSVWYRFIDQSYYSGCCGGLIDLGRQLQNIGRGPTYMDIPNGDYKVRAYPQKNADFGKKVKLFGLDSLGRQLQHKDTAGLWQDGIELVLKAPYAETTQFIRSPSRVLKDRTQGWVTLYAVDTAGVQIDIARYAPTETNPAYSRDRLTGCSCPDGMFVNALVKLAFVPVSGVDADDEVVLAPSLTALEHAVHAVKLGQAGDVAGRVEYMTLAVLEANHVLDNETPQEDAPVNTSFRGHECVGLQNVI